MELTDVIHNNPNSDLKGFEADIFIAASGYEKRATSLAMKYSGSSAEKIVLAFAENKSDLSRAENDRFFVENNFRFNVESGFKAPDFDTILGEQVQKGLRIIIDITSMPGLWYHSFFNYILQQKKCRQIEVKVLYMPSSYQPPSKPGRKVHLKGSPQVNNHQPEKKNQKGTALIMGLGSEKSIGNKVFEIIQPEMTHLLYADPATHIKYVENVLVNNHQIINKIPIRNLHSYPLYDTKKIYDFLIDLMMPLRLNMNVIIVPLGPKIFNLMAVLLHLAYPDIELYYPQYKTRALRDREAVTEYLSVDLVFSTY